MEQWDISKDEGHVIELKAFFGIFLDVAITEYFDPGMMCKISRVEERVMYSDGDVPILSRSH